jgi:hypothetical protein
MATKRSGNKSKSGGSSAGKRTVKKGGARLRDLEAKKGNQVRGGESATGGAGAGKTKFNEFIIS